MSGYLSCLLPCQGVLEAGNLQTYSERLTEQVCQNGTGSRWKGPQSIWTEFDDTKLGRDGLVGE
jgi:hypothetical protein